MADIVQLRPGFAPAHPALARSPLASSALALAARKRLRRLLFGWRTTADLGRLGDRQLADIGLAREEIATPLEGIMAAHRRLWQL